MTYGVYRKRSGGSSQDRHAELDRGLLESCAARDPDRVAAGLHAHLELASDIYAVELAGRSIFAF